MASKIKISTQHDYTQGAVLFVHPADIVADLAFNTRSAPHDDASVEEMAESIKTNGQIHPVLCRKDKDGRLRLVAGFRRHAAGMLISETDDAFRLKATITDCNDEEAFTRNLAENVEHKHLSPIDVAHAQRRCAEQYGWDGKRIATFFRMSASYVSQHKKLLVLPAKIQRQVHEGKIGMSAALALADVDAGEAERIVEETPAETSNDATPAEPKRGGRSAKIRDAARASSGKVDKSSRVGINAVRSLFVTLSEGGSNAEKVATIVLAFLNGEASESETEGELLEVLG